MSKSCKGLAGELVKCLSESDCMKVFNFIYLSCLRSLNNDLGMYLWNADLWKNMKCIKICTYYKKEKEMHRNICILIWSLQDWCYMYWLQVQNRSFRECVREQSPAISTECVGLRETYLFCKRGQACYLLFILNTLFSFSCISFHTPALSFLYLGYWKSTSLRS